MIRKTILLLAVLISLAASNVALAITLQEAKSQGLVGEKQDGYIAAISSPNGEVGALIQTTNSGRQKVYQDLAQRNNIPVEAVGVQSHAKLRDKARAGEYLQSSSGQWARK